MRVLVEVTAGERIGLRTAMRPGQSLSVGRSDWADLACPWDQGMSREHFQLHVDNVSCKLVDLKSRNGTRVNSQPISDVLLRDGDEIQAGETTFRVRIEGDSPDDAVKLHQSSYVEMPEDSAVMRGLAGALNGEFQHEVPRSGLHCFTLPAGDVPPHVLADLLGRDRPLYLLIDLSRLGVEVPEDLPREYLFDFLPEEARAAVSPVLVCASEYRQWSGLAESAWGQDALIYLFTKIPQQELLEKLREACRPQQGGGVAGYCWPSILGAVLLSSDRENLPNFVHEMSLILMESHRSPESLVVHSPRDVRDRLKGFGLRPAEPAASEASNVETAELPTKKPTV